MVWVKGGDSSKSAFCIENHDGGGQPMLFLYSKSDGWRWYTGVNGGAESYIDGGNDIAADHWNFEVLVRTTTGRITYSNGVQRNSDSTVHNFSHHQDTRLVIGNRGYNGNYGSPYTNGAISMLRIGGSAPTAEEINKIYQEERKLFQPNTSCTLEGSSSAVQAMDYDEQTNLLYVATGASNNVFDGLIAQEVEAVCNELGVSFSGHQVAYSSKQSIQYETLTIPLIKAVQELSAQLTTLQQEINILKGE